MKNAVAYVRVSTQEQAREGISLQAQEHRLAAYCQMAGLNLVCTLREEGVSAAKPMTDRPLAREAVKLVACGAVSHVVAVKLDRLFRDTAEALTVTSEWDRAGVALHLVDLGDCLSTRAARWAACF